MAVIEPLCGTLTNFTTIKVLTTPTWSIALVLSLSWGSSENVERRVNSSCTRSTSVLSPKQRSNSRKDVIGHQNKKTVQSGTQYIVLFC